ncbi:hypothetical protein LBMAG52_40260 [Planctomycetia bacterium]|nr:hypothetical protein LBMAG52_40260 [Planctomycetia bacterium]
MKNDSTGVTHDFTRSVSGGSAFIGAFEWTSKRLASAAKEDPQREETPIKPIAPTDNCRRNNRRSMDEGSEV